MLLDSWQMLSTSALRPRLSNDHRTRPSPACITGAPEEGSVLPRRLARLAAALRSCDDARAQSLRLLRIGDTLPRAPLLALGEATRVLGCVSVVHVYARVEDGRLQMAGAADSKLARGMVALLVRGLQGEPVEALEKLTVRDVATAAGLSLALTPGRLNGLDQMLQTLRVQISDQQQQQSSTPVAAGDGASRAPAAEKAMGGTREEPSPVVAEHPRLLWPAAEEEVAVLLSGGVDSSVALHELLQAGRKVRAFYLRIWLEEEQVHAARGECPWEEDWSYCQAVCEQAGVPLEAVSLQKEYQQHVVGYLVGEVCPRRLLIASDCF